MERRVDGEMTGGWIDEQIDKRNRWTKRWTDVWMNEWIGGWKDGRKEVQRDECLNEFKKVFCWANFQVSSFLEQTENKEENKKSVHKTVEIPQENKEAKGHPYLSPFPE